jgi:hypothetical protein
MATQALIKRGLVRKKGYSVDDLENEPDVNLDHSRDLMAGGGRGSGGAGDLDFRAGS